MQDRKLIKGYFWDLSLPDLKQYGELTISPDNTEIKLNVKGFLKCFGNAVFNINYHDKIQIIQGYSMNGEWLTICQLRILNIHGNLSLHALNSKTTEVELDAEYFILCSKEYPIEHFSVIKKVSFSPQFSNSYETETTISCEAPNDDLMNSNLLNRDDSSVIYTLTSSKKIDLPFEKGTCSFKPDYYSIPFNPEDKLDIVKEYDFNFTFTENIDIETLLQFLNSYRQLFSLLKGTYIALENIRVWTDTTFYEFYFRENKRNIYYQSGIRLDHQIAGLENIISSDILNNFSKSYLSIKLPLRHYFDFIENGKDMPHQELLLLVSALEVVFNKTYKVKDSQVEDYPKVAKEILELSCLTKHQKDFLRNFKKGTRIKTFKIKDKIQRLIDESQILTQLINNHSNFVEEILEVRHYIVHESNPSTLELYNNETKLRQCNMKLKVILEYYLLVIIGFERDYLEKRINRTLVNMVQFR